MAQETARLQARVAALEAGLVEARVGIADNKLWIGKLLPCLEWKPRIEALEAAAAAVRCPSSARARCPFGSTFGVTRPSAHAPVPLSHLPASVGMAPPPPPGGGGGGGAGAGGGVARWGGEGG
jgi:hypothetical protein